MFNRASHFYVVAVLAILAIATAIRFADPFFVQALRLIAFDSYQLLEPAEYDPALPVRLVDIDEDSLKKVGQWPWSRLTIADLLDKLARQGAAVVAFDILFSEPDRTSPEQVMKVLTPEEAAAMAPVISGKPTHDARFAEVIAATPTVLATALSERPSPPPPMKAGFAVAGDDPKPFVRKYLGATTNLPELDEAAPGIGSINWIPDRDQVIRRLPLVYRIGDQYVPTLVTEALRVAQGAGTYVLKASNASGETAFGQETGLNHIRVGAIEIPTDANGGIWLQFRPSNRAAYIPAWKVLSGENDPDEIAGNIILVGTSAPGLMDLRATPLDPAIPGFEVHAQALEHIMRGSTITRPDYAIAIEVAITIVIGLLLTVVLPRLAALTSAAIGVTAIGLILVGGYVVYSWFGVLIDPSFPALVLFVLVTTITIYVYRRSEQQKGEVRRAFGYYVSPTVVNEIIAHPDKLELGGEVRELSLLFCDVRNFTSISERMSAHELTRFINNLLTPLSEIILEHRGTIDKYMGDAIMAFWNAPLEDKDHAGNALKSALAMHRRMDELNAQWRGEAEAAGRAYVKVAIGIGINSGNCCVGNLGSSQRFDYSAIGDDVNVASRLEGLSKVYGVPIVLGETTVGGIAGLKAIELDIMRVKGRARPLRIYTPFDVFGADDGLFAALMARHAAMLDRYRGRDWNGAEAAIAECEGLGISGLAGLYAIYRGRIAEWREEPPPADWDGTFTATSK
ncbi:MAG: adenylate/guanylate cyclase domain-containing protein [Bauldia sp.]|nr:adenylate/guanylate cyclase domain-containing protein [Bauldia sp.]